MSRVLKTAIDSGRLVEVFVENRLNTHACSVQVYYLIFEFDFLLPTRPDDFE
jgi:hypothetical protein